MKQSAIRIKYVAFWGKIWRQQGKKCPIQKQILQGKNQLSQNCDIFDPVLFPRPKHFEDLRGCENRGQWLQI